jgi:hypothetical protein
MPTLGRIAVAAALTGALFSLRALPQATAQAAPPRCLNTQLNFTPGPGNGAAGSVYVLYRLHNLRAGACSMFGYPGVQLLDRDFHTLPTFLHRGGVVLNGRTTPAQVTVPGHGNAWFVIRYQDIPANNGSCTLAKYLMVIPPNAFLPIVGYAAQGARMVRACAGNISVSPVAAGHTGF